MYKRQARWYYLSSLANQGLGNSIDALQDARRAVQLLSLIHILFHHSCGYTAFTVDLTSALHLGQKNVVAVRCDSREDLNIPPFGGQMDFLTYGGVCRAVCLDVKEPAYLRDIFIAVSYTHLVAMPR